MANELQAVLRQLGGKRVLGRSLANDRELREAIRQGFPHAVLGQLMQASGLTLKELAGALDLYRMARLLALARATLGDEARASRWLKRSNRALGGVAPLAAIDTEPGARQVENLLGRIAYGGMS
jgi:hypothetical protein